MDKRVIFAVAGSGKTTYIIDSLSQNKGKRSSRPYGLSNVLSFRSVVDVKKSKKFSSPFPTFLTS